MLAKTLGQNAHFTRENKIELLKNVKYPVFPQIYISCPPPFFFALYHRELHFPGFLLSDFWETWPMGGLGGTWEGGRKGESRYISPLLFLLPGTSPGTAASSHQFQLLPDGLLFKLSALPGISSMVLAPTRLLNP